MELQKMKIKEHIEVRTVNEINRSFNLTLSEAEAKSLRDLLDYVKSDWYYDDNTLRVLDKLNNALE